MKTHLPTTFDGPIDAQSIPRHIGVILDGNRRWSQQNSVRPVDGYARGAAKVAKFLDWSERAGVEVVTVWALSADNLKRQPTQLAELLSVITEGLWLLAATGRWCLRLIGGLELVPPAVAIELRKIADKTRHFRGLQVNVAIAYDGRAEISAAVRSLIRDRIGAGMSAEQIAETLIPELINEHLYTAGQPDIDLVIRTSGEQRTSGFLPWQTTYAEFYFPPVLWPDFTESDFAAALTFYQTRQRRFGE